MEKYLGRSELLPTIMMKDNDQAEYVGKSAITVRMRIKRIRQNSAPNWRPHLQNLAWSGTRGWGKPAYLAGSTSGRFGPFKRPLGVKEPILEWDAQFADVLEDSWVSSFHLVLPKAEARQQQTRSLKPEEEREVGSPRSKSSVQVEPLDWRLKVSSEMARAALSTLPRFAALASLVSLLESKCPVLCLSRQSRFSCLEIKAKSYRQRNWHPTLASTQTSCNSWLSLSIWQL